MVFFNLQKQLQINIKLKYVGKINICFLHGTLLWTLGDILWGLMDGGLSSGIVAPLIRYSALRTDEASSFIGKAPDFCSKQ